MLKMHNQSQNCAKLVNDMWLLVQLFGIVNLERLQRVVINSATRILLNQRESTSSESSMFHPIN